MKHNYKCLEEQHYKAQEHIQLLLNAPDENLLKKGEKHLLTTSKTSALFPCNQCTKNFLTADSLKSHEQRKHSPIEEKHESSDDNEKETPGKEVNKKEINDKDISDKGVIDKESNQPKANMNTEENEPSKSQEKNQTEIADQVEVSNNNNNDQEINDCTVCSKKMAMTCSHVAIQCGDDAFTKNNVEENEIKITTGTETQGSEAKFEIDLIRNAYDTINDLKKEILDLRNALQPKTNENEPNEMASNINDSKLEQTNGKIDVIEQKFNAFESKFMESQQQFIESFRNMDERQMSYMNNIQETIMEIVEKSLNKQDADDTVDEINKKNQNDATESIEPMHASNKENNNEVNNELNTEAQHEIQEVNQKPEIKPRNKVQSSYSQSSSESENDKREMICQAEVHTVESDSNESELEDAKTVQAKPRKQSKHVSKEIAINEFEQRLRQFGLDVDSTGLSTPRSQKVNQELMDERDEMKKVLHHFNFHGTDSYFNFCFL